MPHKLASLCFKYKGCSCMCVLNKPGTCTYIINNVQQCSLTALLLLCNLLVNQCRALILRMKIVNENK